jgi:hypothetical protein
VSNSLSTQLMEIEYNGSGFFICLISKEKILG